MKRIAIAVGLSLLTGSVLAQGSSTLSPPGSANTGGATPAPRQDSGIVASPGPAVIHPGNPDPGMTVKPPAAGITPVVPPPGTGGNNPAIIPK